MITVTFQRDGTDLTITNNPNGTTFHMDEGGVGAIEWDLRRAYAPDPAWRAGKTLLSWVRDAAALPLVIYAHADTSAALTAAKAELDAAALQWAYDVTVTIDGESEVFHCEPAIPRWGAFDSGMVRAHMARANLVIPVNP